MFRPGSLQTAIGLQIKAFWQCHEYKASAALSAIRSQPTFMGRSSPDEEVCSEMPRSALPSSSG